jgi:hypothetical protein
MWLHESAKNQILGVDTTGQHVLPRVQYGTTCLLIRNTIGCVSCSIEWRMAWYFCMGPTWCKRSIFWENLSTSSEAFVGETIVKHDILM